MIALPQPSEQVRTLFRILTGGGERFPTANEVELLRLAAGWNAAADALEKVIGPDLLTKQAQIRSGMHGPAEIAFAGRIAQYVTAQPMLLPG